MTAPLNPAAANIIAASCASENEHRSKLPKISDWLLFNVNMTSLVDMTSFNLYHFGQGASVLDVMTGKKLLPIFKRESLRTIGAVVCFALRAMDLSTAGLRFA